MLQGIFGGEMEGCRVYGLGLLVSPYAEPCLGNRQGYCHA